MLLKDLQSLPFGCLVDVGCGTGETLIEWAGAKPHAHFIGIDIAETVLHTAYNRAKESRWASRVVFACGDCLNIPLASDTTEVIVFRGLLHHVEDVSRVFAEVRRVLRKDGLVLIQDGKRMSDQLFHEMNEELSQSGLPRETHPGFDIEELSNRLKAYNLLVEETIQTGIATFATPPYTKRVYSTGLFLISARKTE